MYTNLDGDKSITAQSLCGIYVFAQAIMQVVEEQDAITSHGVLAYTFTNHRHTNLSTTRSSRSKTYLTGAHVALRKARGEAFKLTSIRNA